MNKIAQRTLCSIIFASLVTTQLSGMLSKTHHEKKKILTSVKGSPFSQKEEAHEPIISIEELTQKKSVFSLNPLKNVKDKALSLLKKTKKEEYNEEDDFKEKREKKEKRKKHALIVTSTGLVVGFLVDNRRKFLPKIKAQSEVGLGDLKPVVEGAKAGVKAGIITEIVAAGLGPIAGAIFFVSAAIVSHLANKRGKNKADLILEFLPTESQIDLYEALWNAGNKQGAASLPNSQKLYDAMIERKKKKEVSCRIVTVVSEQTKNELIDSSKTPSPAIPGLTKTNGDLAATTIINPTPSPEISPDPEEYNHLIKLIPSLLKKKQTPDRKPDPLTEEESKTLWEHITIENAIEGIAAGVKGAVFSAKIKAINESLYSIYHIYDRYAATTANDLLGVKIDLKIAEDEWEIIKFKKFYDHLFTGAANFAVDITSSTTEEVFKVILKCMLFEWRSSDECYGRHSEVIRHNIKTIYKKELSQIKDIDQKIKYIKDHKIIPEKTKKAAIDILNQKKEFETQRAIDLKTLNIALESNKLTSDEATRQIAQFKKNGDFLIKFEEDGAKNEGVPLLVTSLVKNGAIGLVKEVPKAIANEWQSILRSLIDDI